MADRSEAKAAGPAASAIGSICVKRAGEVGKVAYLDNIEVVRRCKIQVPLLPIIRLLF